MAVKKRVDEFLKLAPLLERAIRKGGATGRAGVRSHTLCGLERQGLQPAKIEGRREAFSETGEKPAPAWAAFWRRKGRE